ncbi:glycosyltransferase [Listeria newyorkensis]|uniref:Colanic acid biosynthesis glycosyltransferase WcaL n=1 Tax=Listeria newyorkensis TaxID=1497681 RepID=A0A841YWC8_9LIST|nr:glycosyltransferase [Listeria newyorkensis]MBC1457700.1 colanic acid biosynthesis glycosyltransferase WcaL [Listeria newyorkensis]
MKVLFMVSSFPALSETFILNQITGFIDQGHDISILAMTRATGKIHPDVEKYDLMNKVQFVDIPKNPIAKLVKALMIIRTDPKTGMRLLNQKKYGKFVWSFRPLIVYPYLKDQTKYDTLIAHYGSNGLILSILEQNMVEKSFTFFHGNDLTGFVKRFGKEIYAPLFKSQITLLPISKLWREKLIDYGANPEKTKVHHMGVDLTKFQESTFKKSDKVTLLVVGRLTEKKGIDIAISSLKYLLMLGYDVELRIIGDGEEREELKAMTKNLELEDKVVFAGWLNQEEVHMEIEKADIILQPSRIAKNGDMEGIPVALMEALARGKLVVTTKHSGIPELVQDGHNGFLAPENDSLIFAEKIADALNMPLVNKKELMKNARQTVMEEFNIDILNMQLSEMCAGRIDA